MHAPVTRRIARFGAGVALAATGFFGLSQAAHAQVDPYVTTTTEAPTTTVIETTTTEGPQVEASTTVQAETPTTAAVAVEDADLARTGSESGKIALLGLAALGAGGVCVSAARRRASN